MAHVIPLQSVSKGLISSILTEKDDEAYCKALELIDKLKASTACERCEALERWLEAEFITEAQYKATLKFYGYRRGS